jgi:hypothetical protein
MSAEIARLTAESTRKSKFQISLAMIRGPRPGILSDSPGSSITESPRRVLNLAWYLFPWVENRNSRLVEIGLVSRDDREAVLKGGRRNEKIGVRISVT